MGFLGEKENDLSIKGKRNFSKLRTVYDSK